MFASTFSTWSCSLIISSLLHRASAALSLSSKYGSSDLSLCVYHSCTSASLLMYSSPFISCHLTLQHCVNLVKSPLPSPYLHRYVLYVIWTKADIKPAETWFYRVWLIELSLCAKCLLQSCYCLYVLQVFTFADFNYNIWRIKYDFTVISVIPMRRLSAVH